MSQWVSVSGYGAENLEPDVLNRPIRQLTERTNWLYEQLSSLLGTGTFESVRILNAALDTETDYAPSAGDFVQLDGTSRTYKQALATVSSDDAFVASPQAYAVGLLTQVNADGTGTIVLYGKVDLSTSGAGWDLSGMLEAADESYRNGPYFLSSTVAGKMTATPSSLAVYLGQFQEDATNPGYGGTALLNPQYRDMSEAHVHRAYPLYSQPVGAHVLSDAVPIPTTTHGVTGFVVDGTLGVADLSPQLVTEGTWLGDDTTTYTIWISGDAIASDTPVGSSSPSTGDWSSVYLHWASSDDDEGYGVTQMWSFETQHAVGTKGLIVSLEKMTGQDNDVPYNPVTSGDSEDLRTWTIVVPTMTRGWLPNRVRQYLTNNQATDANISLVIYGEFTNADNRAYETITAKCGYLHELEYIGQPSDADTITIEGVTFEFYATAPYAGANTGVLIGSDADETYQSFLEAILAANVNGLGGALANITGGNNKLIVLTPTVAAIVESVANMTIPTTYTGAGNISAGSVGLLVYDEYHAALVDASTPYLTALSAWDETTLSNGLTIMLVPYDDAGNAMVGVGTVATGDYWEGTFVDEAPNAKFKYAMGMHPLVSQFYPPIPRDAATLVVNGIELSSYDIFPSNPDYRSATSTIYWFANGYGSVPWPQDWVDSTDDGSDIYRKNIVYHLVRMAIGNTGIVTSLRPASGSPIRVIQCGTNEAGTTGDLELDLDLNLQTSDNSLAGYNVVKQVTGQKLERGPVVEKIQSDGTITISQSVGAPEGQGIVTISLADQQFAGDFETVALENAKQEVIGMFPYIRLLGWQTGSSSNTPTGFIAKFRVPHTLAYKRRYRVQFYATVFGEVDIPYVGGGSPLYAGLTFEYNVLPDYTAILSPTGADDVWNSLDETLPDGLMTMTTPIIAEIPFGEYNEGVTGTPIYKSYDPMLIHNDNTLPDIARRQAQIFGDPFPVAAQVDGWTDPSGPYVRAGSLVGIRVSRADVLSTGQEYTGAIGFINLRWKLVSAGEDS